MRRMLFVALGLACGCARMETTSHGADEEAAPSADSAGDSAKTRASPSNVVPVSFESQQPGNIAFVRLPGIDENDSADIVEANGGFRDAKPGANRSSTAEALTVGGFLDDVLADHRNYYSPASIVALAAGFGIGAAIANTRGDEGFRDFYQENVRDTKTDEWAEALHTPTVLGNGMMVLPIFATAAFAGEMMDEMPMMAVTGDWGEQSLRTALVGFPTMLLMQKVTGASRPSETEHDSEWRFWNDSNGVSGHSFMGAVPFLTAAKMTHNPWCKASFYLASTGAGLSRINDDRHYASQVLLGWWMAYVAADAVMQTENGQQSIALVPLEAPDGAGIGVELRR